MTDKLPPAWTAGYIPSQAEWQEAFADAITEGAQTAQNAIATQIAAITTTVTGNTTAIAQASTANQQAITALGNIVAKNPAVADQNMGNFKVTALAQGVAATDAARLDQVAWTQIGAAVSAVSLNAVAFTLSTAFIKFRLEWTALSGSASSGILISRFSQDGAQTFDAGANYWFGVSVKVLGGSESYSTSTNSTYIPLTNGQSGNQISEGFIEFSPASGKGIISNAIGANAGFSLVEGMTHYGPTGTNAIFVGLTGGSFSGGRVRLLGWRA